MTFQGIALYYLKNNSSPRSRSYFVHTHLGNKRRMALKSIKVTKTYDRDRFPG